MLCTHELIERSFIISNVENCVIYYTMISLIVKLLNYYDYFYFREFQISIKTGSIACSVYPQVVPQVQKGAEYNV